MKAGEIWICFKSSEELFTKLNGYEKEDLEALEEFKDFIVGDKVKILKLYGGSMVLIACLDNLEHVEGWDRESFLKHFKKVY